MRIVHVHRRHSVATRSSRATWHAAIVVAIEAVHHAIVTSRSLWRRPDAGTWSVVHVHGLIAVWHGRWTVHSSLSELPTNFYEIQLNAVMSDLLMMIFLSINQMLLLPDPNQSDIIALKNRERDDTNTSFSIYIYSLHPF